MRLSLIQFDISWENPEENIAKVGKLVSIVGEFGCDILVLPEMWPCGFTMNSDAHVFGVPALEYMADLAQRQNCHIMGGVPTKVDGGQENQAVWIDATGTIRGRYSKIKTFTFAQEDHFFQSGKEVAFWQLEDLIISPFISPFICYDLRFPELARKAMPQAQVLIYMASWPAPRIHHWRHLLRARAIENQCYVVGVNRIGQDGNGWDYCGSSVVIDPMGRIILDADDQEGVYTIDLSANQVTQTRKNFPFLADMD